MFVRCVCIAVKHVVAVVLSVSDGMFFTLVVGSRLREINDWLRCGIALRYRVVVAVSVPQVFVPRHRFVSQRADYEGSPFTFLRSAVLWWLCPWYLH